jgi:FkbM family methyltransferase
MLRMMRPVLRALRRAVGTVELPAAIAALRVQQEAADHQARAAEEKLIKFLHHLDETLADRLARMEGALAERIDVAKGTLGDSMKRSLADRLDGVANRLVSIEESLTSFRSVYLGSNRILLRFRHLPLVFVAEANDRIIVPHLILTGDYEPDVTAWLLRNLGATETCLDIGAHMGYHSCIMASKARAGRVVALEPDPRSYKLLTENVNINWLEAVVRTECIAASDQPGNLTLHRLRNRSVNTSISQLSTAEAKENNVESAESLVAPATTVDAVVARYGGTLNLMKIDVEGAELLVLRGARATIKANPQLRILMEWSPSQLARAGQGTEGLLNEIESLGMNIHRLRLDGTEEPPASRQTMLNTFYWNVLLQRGRPHSS